MGDWALCRLMFRVVVMATVVYAAGTAAQQPLPPATGTVTGHVYLSDTGAPARLATVGLQPIEVKVDDRPFEQRRADPMLPLTVVGLDGSYSIAYVAAGTYYVVVKQPGYLSPFAQFTTAELAHPAPDVQQKIDATLPMVMVLPNNTATMDIHLTKGASLSGQVRFDDGSPDAQAHVVLMQQDAKGKWTTVDSASRAAVDDQGRYRITGLDAGSYLLRVDVSIDDKFVDQYLGHEGRSTAMTRYNMNFYSGDTPRLRDAKPVQVETSQDMTSADVTIPVSKLHAVTGAIVEAKTGRAINGGKVEISYSDGGDGLVSATVDKDEPVFRFPYVPEGQYTIKVVEAEEVRRYETPSPDGPGWPPVTKETVLQRYGTAEQPLTVTGDVSGVNLSVSAVSKSQ